MFICVHLWLIPFLSGGDNWGRLYHARNRGNDRADVFTQAGAQDGGVQDRSAGASPSLCSLLPVRQLAARRPGGAGGLEGLVEGGQIVFEKRAEGLQGLLELGRGDLVVLAVRAGRGRRGRPVAADDRLDPVDQADRGGLVATAPGRVAGEPLAQVEELQLQAPRVLAELQRQRRRLLDDPLDDRRPGSGRRSAPRAFPGRPAGARRSAGRRPGRPADRAGASVAKLSGSTSNGAGGDQLRGPLLLALLEADGVLAGQGQRAAPAAAGESSSSSSPRRAGSPPVTGR